MNERGESLRLAPQKQDKTQPRTAPSLTSPQPRPVPSHATPQSHDEKLRPMAHAVLHRMTRRCNGWDYRQRAIYQITLVQCERRQPFLARLEIADGRGSWVTPQAARPLKLSPEQIEARVALTPLGEAILGHWKRLADYTPEIRPLYCQIMPDHLHAILEVTRPMARPLGNAIGGFKTGCEKIYRKLALSAQGNKPALSAQNVGSSTVDASHTEPAPHLWAEGFQDTILLHAGQLDNMFHYLADNARRLAIKRLFPNLFRVVSGLKVNLHLTPPRHPDSPSDTANPRSVLAAQAANSPARFVGTFSALGNRFLLKRPLLQVQVSRRDFTYRRVPKPGGHGQKIARDENGTPLIAFSSPAFEEKCSDLLTSAKHGAVLISPCVSDGEREIARRALEARLNLVTLVNKGFSPLQKPSGRYFDACSDGRLLMLSPIAWPYVPGEKPMTRSDALVLNRLAQMIAGDGAVDINYHGVKFDDIDLLSLKAVKGV